MTYYFCLQRDLSLHGKPNPSDWECKCSKVPALLASIEKELVKDDLVINGFYLHLMNHEDHPVMTHRFEIGTLYSAVQQSVEDMLKHIQ